MKDTILMGVDREVHSVPDRAFVKSMKDIPARMAARLAFMTRDDHKVRDVVVRELPRQNMPLSPLQITQVTGLTTGRVTAILAELERNLVPGAAVRKLIGYTAKRMGVVAKWIECALGF